MPVIDYSPDLSDVGAETLQRTRDKFGVVTGTFSSASTPTDVQVEILVNNALWDVARTIGEDIPEGFWEAARHVVALRTAMFIEQSYFAEQIANERSPYNIMKEHFDEDLASLLTAIQSEQQTGIAGQSGNVRWFFPPPVPPAGWLTKRM